MFDVDKKVSVMFDLEYVFGDYECTLDGYR